MLKKSWMLICGIANKISGIFWPLNPPEGDFCSGILHCCDYKNCKMRGYYGSI